MSTAVLAHIDEGRIPHVTNYAVMILWNTGPRVNNLRDEEGRNKLEQCGCEDSFWIINNISIGKEPARQRQLLVMQCKKNDGSTTHGTHPAALFEMINICMFSMY